MRGLFLNARVTSGWHKPAGWVPDIHIKVKEPFVILGNNHMAYHVVITAGLQSGCCFSAGSVKQNYL